MRETNAFITPHAEERAKSIFCMVQEFDAEEAGRFVQSLQDVIDYVDSKPNIGTVRSDLDPSGETRGFWFGGGYCLLYRTIEQHVEIMDIHYLEASAFA